MQKSVQNIQRKRLYSNVVTIGSLITVFVINILHAALHIVQFIQSCLLVYHSKHNDKNDIIEHILHHPLVNFVWIVVGIISLYTVVNHIVTHKHKK